MASSTVFLVMLALVYVECFSDIFEVDKRGGPEVHVTCESNIAKLDCPAGMVINVVSAVYGRADRTTCPHSAMRDISCAAEGTRKVGGACNGKRACRVSANNGLFTDPCVGTYKYLTTKFNCIPADAKVGVTCEGRVAALTCPAGQVIEVVNAVYGRSNRATCRHAAMRDVTCAADGSNKVGAACNGKQACKIRAENGIFTDPCVGTYKYLKTIYRCKATAAQVAVTCEGKVAALQCPAGKVINVVNAVYGRSDRTTCLHSAMGDITCAKDGSKQVGAACNGKQACKIAASNGIFTDPCVGTYKYLTTTFRCQAGSVVLPAKKRIVCEHRTMRLACPSGQRLQIVAANYGRTVGRSVCPHSAMRTTNCRAANSKALVHKMCGGKRACVIRAKNSVFGDPCYGTYKYLEVQYRCAT